MARLRTRALTVGTALLAVVALALPTTAPAFAEPGDATIRVWSATPAPTHGDTAVSFKVTIENAPAACLVADYPFHLEYEYALDAPTGDESLEGEINGGQSVTGTTLEFTYLLGTVAGPSRHSLYAQTEDPCLGGTSFGESAYIDVAAAPTAGTTISGTVYEQQVGGSTDPDDYMRREGVDIVLMTTDGDGVSWATTAPDGTFSLVAPHNDDYDENTQYLLRAETLAWDYAYFYVAGSGPGSPSAYDRDDATVFAADAGTAYDIYAGRPAGVDPTNLDHLCYSSFETPKRNVVTDLVEWEDVCLSDGSITDAALTYTRNAFSALGYVAFPAIPGRVPDTRDAVTDYFATIDDADDTDFEPTPTGAVVRFRDEAATVHDDDGDLVSVDVDVELVIDGQWARWMVEVFEAGTTTPATDVTFYLVGALGSGADTVWLGDDEVSVSWDGGLDDSPIIGHRATGGEAWHRANAHGDMAVRAHGDLEYEVVVIDVCPSNVDLEDALAPVAGAAFGDEIAYFGDGCPTLPEWVFPPPAFKVGEPFDQTFRAPSHEPWDWTEGGEIDLYDLPDGLSFLRVDRWEDGVAPGVRIFGTPTTIGDYEFEVFLQDGTSHLVEFLVEGTVAPAGSYVYTGDDTIHGVVHVQESRGGTTAADYGVRNGVHVALVSLDYGTLWDDDYTDADGTFTLTADVESPSDEIIRFAILVEVDDRWYFYEQGAGFGDPSTPHESSATPLRPIDFDGDASYDVYAGRASGVSDTVASKVCRWNDSLWQDVETASAYWFDLCLTDGSIEDAETAHADDAFDGFGNVVFPSRLDHVPQPASYRLDYFVSADEHTVTDTATGAILTLVDRDIDVLDEASALVKVDVEVTLEISGQWARWQVDVYRAGTRIPADDVPFYFVGEFGSDDDTVWQGSGARAVSWDGGWGDPLIGHRVSGDDDWSYSDGDDTSILRAFGELTYELALVDWCDGAGDPMADLLGALGSAAFGSTLAQAGGACNEVPTWDFPARSFSVGVPFDQTFTAPTDGLWDWTDGGLIQAYDLPAGLSAQALNTEEAGVPPAVRIFGTPVTAGAYRFIVQLEDGFGHYAGFYVSGKVAPFMAPGGDDETPADDGDIDLDIDLEPGDLVEGGEVTVTASGLQEGADFDLTVRSTPQVLARGAVPIGGTVIRTVALPKLEAGWHSLTFTSTWANGKPAVGRVWFLVSSTGTLLQVSNHPPNLATTGAGIAGSLTLASLALLTGLGLVALRRRRSATA